MLLLEELEIGKLVAAQAVNDVVALQKLGQLARLVLEPLDLGHDLLALDRIVVRPLVKPAQLALELGHVVGHVRPAEQGELGLEDMARLARVPRLALFVLVLRASELEQREDHMPVQICHDLRQHAAQPGRLYRRRDIGCGVVAGFCHACECDEPMRISGRSKSRGSGGQCPSVVSGEEFCRVCPPNPESQGTTDRDVCNPGL